MMKPATIISHDKDIQPLVIQYERMYKHFKQRLEFLQKQCDNLNAEANVELQGPVKQIVQYLIDSKKMPFDNYDPKQHHIHIDMEDNVIFACDGNHQSPGSIRDLLAGL